MSISVVLGNTPYVIPSPGANPVDAFWGDNITNWIKDASARITAFSQLLPETTVTLLINQTSTTIAQLSFSPTLYRRVLITFGITRTGVSETGTMILTSANGTSWDYTIEYDGNVPTDVTLSLSGNDVVYSVPNSGANGVMKVTAEGLAV